MVQAENPGVPGLGQLADLPAVGLPAGPPSGAAAPAPQTLRPGHQRSAVRVEVQSDGLLEPGIEVRSVAELDRLGEPDLDLGLGGPDSRAGQGRERREDQHGQTEQIEGLGQQEACHRWLAARTRILMAIATSKAGTSWATLSD